MPSALAQAQAGQVLARDGRTHYVIALARDAIPAEVTAAHELAAYLHQVTGATFAIRPETKVPAAAAQILVGAGARVKRLLPRQDWRALGADGVVLKTVGRSLVLAGGRPRGALYAVYQFLEEQAGVRWWTPTESAVPRRSRLRLPKLDIVYRPPFRYREHATTPVLRDPLFAARLRENSQGQDETLGGHDSILGSVHTFYQLLPPAKYFNAHPEWYSDADNGGKPSSARSRLPEPMTSQLCLANEAARRELARVALEWLRGEHRKSAGARMISISQNDSRHRCTSEGDLALEALEGSPAGPLLHFVNAVAAEIEQEFPDVVVETLAYLHTRKPPRLVRPRHNVLVRLCSIEADFARPLDAETNRGFLADMNGWKAIAPRLYVWDYVTNFMNAVWPHPNLRVLGPNLRFFAASGVSGVYEQGDAFTNGVGDFVQLRAWLLSRLMWNPHRDETRLMVEFLRGYYGAAAADLLAYLDLVHGAFLRSGKSLSTFQTDHSYLTLAVMNQATRHFRDAERAVAKDPVLARRVRRERLALDHVWIVRHRVYAREAQAGDQPFEGPPDAAAAAAEFVRAAQAFGVANFNEVESFASYAPKLLARNRPAAPLPAGLGDAVSGNTEQGEHTSDMHGDAVLATNGQGVRAGDMDGSAVLGKAAKSEQANDIIDAQEDAFHYSALGGLVRIADDVKASEGKALRISGANNPWAMRYVIDEDPVFLARGPWRCYVVARIERRAGAAEAARNDPALLLGLYDPDANRYAARVSKTLAEMDDGEYRLFDLGLQSLHPAMYFYFSLAGNPGIEAIHVDRVLLIRATGAVAR